MGEDLFQEENAAFQHEGGSDVTKIQKGGENCWVQNQATKTTLCSLQKIQSLRTLVLFGEPASVRTSLSGTTIKLSPTERAAQRWRQLSFHSVAADILFLFKYWAFTDWRGCKRLLEKWKRTCIFCRDIYSTLALNTVLRLCLKVMCEWNIWVSSFVKDLSDNVKLIVGKRKFSRNTISFPPSGVFTA